MKARRKYLFDALNLQRLEYYVEASNDRMLKLAERLGWQKEGLLKRVGYYNGAYHDFVAFSELKEIA